MSKSKRNKQRIQHSNTILSCHRYGHLSIDDTPQLILDKLEFDGIIDGAYYIDGKTFYRLTVKGRRLAEKIEADHNG